MRVLFLFCLLALAIGIVVGRQVKHTPIHGTACVADLEDTELVLWPVHD